MREALRVLEYMRLVEKRHGNGIYVIRDPADLSLEGLVFRSVIEDGLDSKSLRAAFEAIVHVESAMAAMAAIRRTEEDLVQCRTARGDGCGHRRCDAISWVSDRCPGEGVNSASPKG